MYIHEIFVTIAVVVSKKVVSRWGLVKADGVQQNLFQRNDCIDTLRRISSLVLQD